MIYLKNFETTEEYDAYIAGEPIFPNVSLTEDDNKVHYLKRKPLATNFISDNYYIPEAEYFIEISNDVYSLVDNSYPIIDLNTGLLNDEIDVSHYPWFSYLTTPLYTDNCEVKTVQFREGKAVDLGSGMWFTINPESSNFGYYRQVPL